VTAANDRERLLRILRQGAPECQHQTRRLRLPSVEEVRDADPTMVSTFSSRRKALWEEYLRLRNRISHLDDEEFARHKLLTDLFGAGETETLAACWQSVHAIRGSEAINGFNRAANLLALSGCIDVIDPESTNSTTA